LSSGLVIYAALCNINPVQKAAALENVLMLEYFHHIIGNGIKRREVLIE
jgi:hypothetical protein